MMKNVQDLKELEPVITRMTGQNLKCYANATAHSWVALLTELYDAPIYRSMGSNYTRSVDIIVENTPQCLISHTR